MVLDEVLRRSGVEKSLQTETLQCSMFGERSFKEPKQLFVQTYISKKLTHAKKGEMILPSLTLSNAFWKFSWILQTAFKQNSNFVLPHNCRLILYGTSIQ